jgi:hypothetical protein
LAQAPLRWAPWSDQQLTLETLLLLLLLPLQQQLHGHLE